jgi:hypothetical protein
MSAMIGSTGVADEASWANAVLHGHKGNDESYTDVVRKKRKIVNGTKVTSGSISCGVKAVPRPLVAFVGRLHIDTMEKDLCDMLQEVGIEDAKCIGD